MAGRDASIPQADFPQLVADIIRQLRLTGQLGILNMSDLIVPTYIVASREGALTITASPPTFTSASTFNNFTNVPSVNQVLLDTGPLPAGTYDVFAMITSNGAATTGVATISLQHRNAANSATLAVLLNRHTGSGTDVTSVNATNLAPMAYVIAANERLRIQVLVQTFASGGVSCVIGALIRPTP